MRDSGFTSVWCLILIAICNVNSHYTPQWAVHIKGGQTVAEEVAAEHGFLLLGEVRFFNHVFFVEI